MYDKIIKEVLDINDISPYAYWKRFITQYLKNLWEKEGYNIND